jgi:hypothetical protein
MQKFQLKGTGHLGELGVNSKIILKFMLMKQGVRVWTIFIRLTVGYSGEIL